MYVCLCKAVTDGQIRKLVDEGVRSWSEVRKQTGCGTQCGKCACIAKEVTQQAVRDALSESAAGLAYAV